MSVNRNVTVPEGRPAIPHPLDRPQRPTLGHITRVDLLTARTRRVTHNNG